MTLIQLALLKVFPFQLLEASTLWQFKADISSHLLYLFSLVSQINGVKDETKLWITLVKVSYCMESHYGALPGRSQEKILTLAASDLVEVLSRRHVVYWTRTGSRPTWTCRTIAVVAGTIGYSWLFLVLVILLPISFSGLCHPAFSPSVGKLWSFRQSEVVGVQCTLRCAHWVKTLSTKKKNWLVITVLIQCAGSRGLCYEPILLCFGQEERHMQSLNAESHRWHGDTVTKGSEVIRASQPLLIHYVLLATCNSSWKILQSASKNRQTKKCGHWICHFCDKAIIFGYIFDSEWSILFTGLTCSPSSPP